MLRTRIWMGASLIVLTVGVLVVDGRLAPWYPFLFVLVLLLTLGSCYELRQLLAAAQRPPAWLCYLAVAVLVAANWFPSLVLRLVPSLVVNPEAWAWIAAVFAAVVLLAFIAEMATFEVPGTSVARLSLAVWIAAYLGLLPSFLVQL